MLNLIPQSAEHAQCILEALELIADHALAIYQQNPTSVDAKIAARYAIYEVDPDTCRNGGDGGHAAQWAFDVFSSIDFPAALAHSKAAFARNDARWQTYRAINAQQKVAA